MSVGAANMAANHSTPCTFTQGTQLLFVIFKAVHTMLLSDENGKSQTNLLIQVHYEQHLENIH
jgi:hypothetical protein